MKKCPKCGKEYDDSWVVCLSDNEPLVGEDGKAPPMPSSRKKALRNLLLFLVAAPVISVVVIHVSDLAAKRYISSFPKDQPAVQGVADRFYGYFSEEKFGDIYDTLTDTEFRKNVSRGIFIRSMEDLYGRSGSIRKYELQGYKWESRDSSQYWMLQYMVTREKGSTVDLIVLKRNGDLWLLSRYDIT